MTKLLPKSYPNWPWPPLKPKNFDFFVDNYLVTIKIFDLACGHQGKHFCGWGLSKAASIVQPLHGYMAESAFGQIRALTRVNTFDLHVKYQKSHSAILLVLLWDEKIDHTQVCRLKHFCSVLVFSVRSNFDPYFERVTIFQSLSWLHFAKDCPKKSSSIENRPK